jgi:hypothetical protein
VAEQVRCRHAHVVEEQFRRVVRLQADLVEVAPALETLDFVRLDDDQRRALRTGGRVGLGDDDDQIGELAIGDERLRAVDDIVVAVLLRARLHALQVGTGAGFGHRDGADQFAGRHFRQPLGLLFFRSVMLDVGRDDRVVQRDAEAVDADMADRFEDRGFMRVGAARAAELFRHRGAQQSVLAGFLPAFAIEDLGFLECVVTRQDFVRHEARRHVLKHDHVFGGPIRTRYAQDFGRIARHWFLPSGSHACR